MSTTDDKAQSVLLAQLAELRPLLPKDLLLACYKAEREHQFDRDADIVVSQLRRLVEQALVDDSAPESSPKKKPGSRA